MPARSSCDKAVDEARDHTDVAARRARGVCEEWTKAADGACQVAAASHDAIQTPKRQGLCAAPEGRQFPDTIGWEIPRFSKPKAE